MKRTTVCWLAAAAVVLTGLAAAPAAANVYASGLKQTGPNSLSFILNENADLGVTIQVWQVGGGMVYSESLGAKAKGTHTWAWNGSGASPGNVYKVKIVASSSGYSSWTKISTDTPLTNFYSPRGVAVNTNPGSQYFGRVYVSESLGGTCAAGRTVQDGIYILNADLSDAVGQGDNARTGGVAWSTTNSPFRVNVGPDNNVYVCDWSDLHSGLWMGDPDFNTATELLDSTGRDANGMNTTHGSISDFVVEGTGASRKIYTADEDLPSSTSGQRGSIWRYDIGENDSFSGAPSGLLYDDLGTGGNLIFNYYNSLVRANDGTWWYSQDRSGSSTDTLLSLMQISADGSTVLWRSVPDLAANSGADPVRRTRGLAYDPVRNYLALATYNAGKVHIFDPVTKTIITSITTVSNATNRDVAFDAAGNLYIVDNVNERLWVWSPGEGPNSFTTESWFTIPEPSSLAALLLGLPLIAWRRRK
ncbi:MAG: PEP-CTERM sorting domain-containing protein [Armatimonadota bacterium]